MICYKIYSLIVAIFDFMHTTSMYVVYTWITDSLFYVVKNQTQKNLGVMLTHLFGLPILLLQVIIQRAEFFKNITVGAEPEFFNTVLFLLACKFVSFRSKFKWVWVDAGFFVNEHW